jgi:beta-mannosidase
VSAANWIADAPVKAYDFPELKLSWTVSGDSVTVRAETLALFVQLESDARGHFQDGGFFLVPGEERVIRFTGESHFADTLTVRSLRDSY